MAYSKLRGARKTKKKDDEKAKLLEEDAFQEQGKKLVDKVMAHPYFVFGTVASIILLVIISYLISGVFKSRNDNIAMELTEAVKIYSANVEESSEFTTEADKLRKSIELFEKVIKNQKGSINAASAQIYVGKAYYKLNDFGKAAEAFSNARKMSALDNELAFGAYEGEALVHLDNKEYDKAVGIWKEWLNKKTGFYKDHALYYIGTTLEKAGKKDDAIAYYQRLKDEYPKSTLIAKIVDKLPKEEVGS
jgi:tetratricopeptide (TPR) repeat protein